MPAVLTDLMTAEEFSTRPDDGVPMELVRGRIVRMNLPKPLHGLVCNTASFLITAFVRQHHLGWVFSNDSGVITERDPDSVRGPDVAYCSYERLPKAARPQREYLDVAPELVVEVRTADDRWPALQAKVAEYLAAGVLTVCVLDAIAEFAVIYTADAAPRQLAGDDVVEFPEALPGFAARVCEFFE
ncbi:MAG: Uma2 family endonuclease [Planctomycetaceae bacterium]